ncbi:hypothetical protein D8768_23895 [Enterobacter hormaechei]|nr:hypothetical protein D8768_23895 [Enterobacter hormaechei]RQN42141.1 hypothetical protein C3451_19375 [Enterobacter sp. 301B]RCA14942.1 hypothetical protein C6A49_22010 [Enterobacter hormaechei]RSA33601.1 hypothetical protein EGK21_18270 [Enterobacter hormaechei]RTO78063.1 hypothetical protein EKN59_19095 [Enterobacter hormaechei]
MFEGIPKELPQIFHLTQDFFMTHFCSRRTISFKIVVLYREKIEMKIFHFLARFIRQGAHDFFSARPIPPTCNDYI